MSLPIRIQLRTALPSCLALVALAAAPAAVADQHEEAPVEEAPAEGAPAPAAPETVARGLFTLAVADREPGEAVTRVPADVGEVFFFTELVDLEGRTVVHRWEWNGQVMAEVAFDVGGPRWRVWSRKALLPEWRGEWSVRVLDDAGAVLAERRLEVTAPSPVTEPSAQPAAEPPAEPSAPVE
jgi:hypothetical protein